MRPRKTSDQRYRETESISQLEQYVQSTNKSITQSTNKSLTQTLNQSKSQTDTPSTLEVRLGETKWGHFTYQ